MIYLLSWRGRGLLALAALVFPIGLALVTEPFAANAFLLAFALGFIAAGSLCWALGRKWNGAEKRHAFGPFKLQTWGLIYIVFGALMLPAGIGMARGTFG